MFLSLKQQFKAKGGGIQPLITKDEYSPRTQPLIMEQTPNSCPKSKLLLLLYLADYQNNHHSLHQALI